MYDKRNIYKGFTHIQNDGRSPKLTEKAEKIRVSVTLTKPYLDALDRLIREGIYLGRGEVIMEALRDLLREYGLAPFSSRGANPDTNQ